MSASSSTWADADLPLESSQRQHIVRCESHHACPLNLRGVNRVLVNCDGVPCATMRVPGCCATTLCKCRNPQQPCFGLFIGTLTCGALKERNAELAGRDAAIVNAITSLGAKAVISRLPLAILVFGISGFCPRQAKFGGFLTGCRGPNRCWLFVWPGKSGVRILPVWFKKVQ